MKLNIFEMLEEAKEVNCEKRFFVKLFGDLKLRVDAVESGYLCVLGVGNRFNFKPISYKIIGVNNWEELQEVLTNKFGVVMVNDYETILNLVNQGLFNGFDAETRTVELKRLNFHKDYKREWERV